MRSLALKQLDLLCVLPRILFNMIQQKLLCTLFLARNLDSYFRMTRFHLIHNPECSIPSSAAPHTKTKIMVPCPSALPPPSTRS